MPGFSLKKIKKGLPCMTCLSTTSSIKFAEKICVFFDNKHTIMFPKGKEFEDTMYCNTCNP